MNPNPNPNMKVTTNTFDNIMEEAFLPAAGMRKTCGARPLRHAPRYWGKGGASLFTAENAGYQKCINQLRDLNVSSGMPADTGLPSDSIGAGDVGGKTGSAPVDYSTAPTEGMSTGMKVGIAIGVIGLLAVGFVVVTKMTKPKAPVGVAA